ncbi:MinD/ParA family protein [Thioalkalicoccus limnaeus]|uniref:MinD/ParA family protein n=1 Tax=Thioalkalicoccus limnaeus TaxID=120681 RepID=A0ABV4BF67_9GAMM
MVERSSSVSYLARSQPVQVVAVASGKGGVGKTSVSVNLGVAMARRGHETMLFDADLGLANVGVLLGLQSRHDLSHVMEGRVGLEEILIDGPAGLKIVPGASGISRMASLSRPEQAGLVRAFSDLPMPIDFLLVDTAAGISEDVVFFARAAQDVLLVVCDEPASLMDAYALIKVLNKEHGVSHFNFVANMVPSAQQGRRLYSKLLCVTDRFLDIVLSYLGTIPIDEQLRKAVQHQRAVTDLYPRSRSAIAFDELARTLEARPRTYLPSGHPEFFLERMVQAGAGCG